MDVIGGGDVHRVHIGAVDQVVIIGKAVGLVDAIGFPGVAQGLGVDVAHSYQLQVGAFRDAGQMDAAGDSANAYAAHSNNCHNKLLQICWNKMVLGECPQSSLKFPASWPLQSRPPARTGEWCPRARRTPRPGRLPAPGQCPPGPTGPPWADRRCGWSALHG